MHTTTHNAAPKAVQAKPCQKCRDNFPLPEAEAVFDQHVVHGYLVRRGATTACPAADKPCMTKAPQHPQQAPKPTPPNLPNLVLQAQDCTESLRTVLRACHAVASLAAGATHLHSTASMDGLGELLHLHSDAMEQRLDSIGTLIDTLRTAIGARPTGDRARHLAMDASDQHTHMRQAQLAFAAVADMVPCAADSLTGENLGAALRLLADAMAERTAAMDDMLDALHAVLTTAPAQQGQPA
ncbi:MAG: hypothetical protein KKB95_22280 [Gammaproteobacteria bacterium]|nr:hypothetical protein [Gammaproteobacteria bacterium]MBU1507282.1 hypothetical protein [Gammaproteobacteria bacterium]MBU2120883.1 hypothetical protein [Gammaproteobacteria bacterium]MBU2169598.1 hypothetical protein [Gammaproteobacteria bacterium]MBU2201731.1 hypothetical protein [Gammaproteobacteria bacterium]